MGSAIRLEAFDAVDQTEDTQAITYQQGFDAGFAAAQAAAAREQGRLQAELVQAISDLEFTYTEARGALTQSLGPLFEVIAQVILPHCVAAGWTGQIAAILQAATAGNLAAPLKVAVHPQQRQTIAAALETAYPHLHITTDDSLGLHAAWIGVGEQETLLDLDRTLSQIVAVLGAIDPQKTRLETHG